MQKKPKASRMLLFMYCSGKCLFNCQVFCSDLFFIMFVQREENSHKLGMYKDTKASFLINCRIHSLALTW